MYAVQSLVFRSLLGQLNFKGGVRYLLSECDSDPVRERDRREPNICLANNEKTSSIDDSVPCRCGQQQMR